LIPLAVEGSDLPINFGFALYDRSQFAVRGSHAPEGVTYTVRLVGRREIFTLTKRNGKVLTQESLRVSNDGRVITYSWWDPGRPTEKGTLVYEKK